MFSLWYGPFLSGLQQSYTSELSIYPQALPVC